MEVNTKRYQFRVNRYPLVLTCFSPRLAHLCKSNANNFNDLARIALNADRLKWVADRAVSHETGYESKTYTRQ